MKEELTTIELTEENIESMVYEIRNQKVMLDSDLARIYGYETKRFNEQVKNNIEKFPGDFMFRLTKEEADQLVWSKQSASQKSMNESDISMMPHNSDPINKQILMPKKSTSSWGGTRKLPYAFTEQGIYMLMTVLKGELAVKQSKALIRLFKRMKDYISLRRYELNGETIKLVNLVNDNTKRIDLLESKIDVVMDSFADPNTYKHFLLLNDQRIEADVAYQQIYSLAKLNIHIIDDYIDLKTLQLLKICPPNIEVTIFSDNRAKNNLTKQFLDDFIKDNSFGISLKKSGGLSHDRFIFIDYGTDREKLFHCGGSSKDAGKRISTIISIENTELYHPLIEKLLLNEELCLSDQ